MAPGDSKLHPPRRDLVAFAAWGTLALVLAWHGFAFVRADVAAPPRCEPITFDVAGSPPAFVHAELELAMQEIHARTGLVFEPASSAAPGGATRPKLSVSWAANEAPRPASALVVADPGTAARLGYGAGRWQRVQGGRELLEAAVEVNGNLTWRQGLDASDGLAAVFVHELGHVVGLFHNDDPASFMHHQANDKTPIWTEADAAQLAEFGRQAGCLPR